MARSFRVHESIIDDPLLWRLSREDFGDLVRLWALASWAGQDGRLPHIDDIAIALRRPIEDMVAPLPPRESVQKLIDRLEEAGAIERIRGGPTGWWYGVRTGKDVSLRRSKDTLK